MKMVLRQFANCLDVAFKLLFRGSKSLVIMMMFPIAAASPSPSMSGDAAGAGGDANPDAAAAADPSALAAAKPKLPDDLSYCSAGVKDEMLNGGGFKYSDDYLYNDWHIAKAWIIFGCSALALFVIADLLVHRFKNTNNLGRE